MEYTIKTEDLKKNIYKIILREFECLPNFIILKVGKKKFFKVILSEKGRIKYLLNNGYAEIYDQR